MYIFIYILKEILPKKIKNDYLWVIHIYIYIYLWCFTCDEKLILKKLFKGHNILKKLLK